MAEETTLPKSDSFIGISASASNDSSTEEDYVFDFDHDQEKFRRNSEKHVRQQVIKMLLHDYGIPMEDIAVEFPVRTSGKQKRLDIAIFNHGQTHLETSLNRIIVCRPRKYISNIRGYNQAEKDLQELKTLMAELPSCKYGLWTNSLEFFYLEKRMMDLGSQFDPLSDWPLPEDVSEAESIPSRIHTRQADSDILQTSFRRCQIFMQGNEGLPEDMTFWQLLYLVFCKIHDESAQQDERRFWAGLREQFNFDGRKQIKTRIQSLFQEVKETNKHVFRGNEAIILSDPALAFVVSELARYDFASSPLNAKEVAFREIVGPNFRRDRGQYFTPEGISRFMVEFLDPEEGEDIFDPACGTGDLLLRTWIYVLEKLSRKANVLSAKKPEKFRETSGSPEKFLDCKVAGADFDPFMIKATQVHMALMGFTGENLYQLDSLAFPEGNTIDLRKAKSDLRLGTFDVLMTNPPFGSQILITDKSILSRFELAHIWKRGSKGNFIITEKLHESISAEILFIERCLQWLKPGGRLGIVLPRGILGNTAHEYIRWWILQKAWILAIVDLPVEAFLLETNIHILTSLLFLKKKTKEEINRETQEGETDYPVFMAVAEKVGIDSQGHKLYKRTPDGEEIVDIQDEIERFQIGRRVVERNLRHEKRVPDDDLPTIVQEYKESIKQQISNHNLPYTLRGTT
jgi:type I restriction enzyme M protein